MKYIDRCSADANAQGGYRGSALTAYRCDDILENDSKRDIFGIRIQTNGKLVNCQFKDQAF
jgi:hypothetical protein